MSVTVVCPRCNAKNIKESAGDLGCALCGYGRTASPQEVAVTFSPNVVIGENVCVECKAGHCKGHVLLD